MCFVHILIPACALSYTYMKERNEAPEWGVQALGSSEQHVTCSSIGGKDIDSMHGMSVDAEFRS